VYDFEQKNWIQILQTFLIKRLGIQKVVLRILSPRFKILRTTEKNGKTEKHGKKMKKTEKN